MVLPILLLALSGCAHKHHVSIKAHVNAGVEVEVGEPPTCPTK